MPDRLLGVVRHQAFEFTFGTFVVEEGRAGVAVQRRKLRPGIRRTHVDDADYLEAWAWRLCIDQVGRFPRTHAAPEFLLGGNKYTEVEWVHWDRDFHPFSAAGDDRQGCGPQMCDPHVMLHLG